MEKLVDFVNRTEELRILTALLDSREPAPILVKGSGGIGKSYLVSRFVESHFPTEDIYWVRLYDNPSASSEFRRVSSALSKRSKTTDCIVVVDGAENAHQQVLSVHISHLKQTYPGLKMIITSRSSIELENLREIDLDNLSVEHSVSLLEVLLGNRVEYRRLEELSQFTGGHPLALHLFGRYLQSHDVEKLESLSSFSAYGPSRAADGKETEKLIRAIQPQIVVANDYLIEHLKKFPSDIHTLTPRKFEELVAELLTGMGWDVQLTKATRDGGSDILASMHTDLGTFLTLVEAKKYSPHRPVGVSLVRELYGTMMDFQANQALLVTTSRFTKDASEFKRKHSYQIGLKDYFDLLDWIGKHSTDTHL